MKRIYYLILTSALMGALSSSASASCERLCQVDFWKWSTQEDVTQTITELQSLVEAGHKYVLTPAPQVTSEAPAKPPS